MAASALILDLDGTLWDSWPWYASLVGGSDDNRCAEILDSLDSGRPIARMLRDAGIPETRFRHLCDGPCSCALYPGVFEGLEELAARGTRLGVATNLPAWIATPMLDAVQISPLLESVVCYGNTTRHKPHPEPLLAVLAEFGIPASDAWYVGDTESDATASVAAGLRFAWAAYGYGQVQPHCDRFIERFADVLAL
jgi:phosphoglycolate phosphatase-like HAD superfamily hydrolase